MRVHVHPADDGGCGRYRMTWPAEALAAQGFDVHIMRPDSEDARIQCVMNMRNGVETVVDVIPPECDVIVLQRPLDRRLADTIPLLQCHGVAVVVELDDDFEKVDPRNVAWVGSHPNNAEHNWKHMHRAIAAADGYTCTTSALLRLNPRGTIIPNYVPERYLKITKTYGDPLRIGWSGSLNVHPDDLPEVGGSVAKLVHSGDFRFGIVGTGQGIHRSLGLSADVDIAETGWVPVDDYAQTMADSIDVGIVPLKQTLFNQAKSWLKGLEFASLGIPFVASPTEPYSRLQRYQLGELAVRSKHWAPMIRSMGGDVEELGSRYRERVRANDLTIERRAHEWLEAWRRAADRRAACA